MYLVVRETPGQAGYGERSRLWNTVCIIRLYTLEVQRYWMAYWVKRLVFSRLEV
jgi:hypothetical protein